MDRRDEVGSPSFGLATSSEILEAAMDDPPWSVSAHALAVFIDPCLSRAGQRASHPVPQPRASESRLTRRNRRLEPQGPVAPQSRRAEVAASTETKRKKVAKRWAQHAQRMPMSSMT